MFNSLIIAKKQGIHTNHLFTGVCVYLNRSTIKFCNYPFFLVYNNLECGIPAIISDTVGNCYERTGCRGEILDMD